MTDRKKKFYRKNNRQAYITSAVGIVAIAGLIYAGIALNEEPDMKIEMSPSPTSIVNPQGGFTWADPTKTPTKVPGGKTPAKELPKVTSGVNPTSGAANPNPTEAPHKEQQPKVTEQPQPTKGASENAALQVNAAIAALTFPGEGSMNWPVLGEVVLPYSMEHIIYHKTLNTFRVSDGVLLSAKEGDNVVCAADGIITEIIEDDMHGNCIVMAVGDDYRIIYGQMSKTEHKVGDSLKEGDVLGTIAKPTKYYSLEGAHLYLKMVKGEEPVNPMLYLRVTEENAGTEE